MVPVVHTHSKQNRNGTGGEYCTHVVSIAPGLIEFTRMPCGPSSHAMVRAIWSTADLEVLYDSHS